MKQKDILLLVVVSIISGALSLTLSNLLISSPKNRSAKVTIVDKISTEFQLPDQKYFNSNAIDPIKLIKPGDSSNPKPFN